MRFALCCAQGVVSLAKLVGADAGKMDLMRQSNASLRHLSAHGDATAVRTHPDDHNLFAVTCAGGMLALRHLQYARKGSNNPGLALCSDLSSVRALAWTGL